MLKDISQFNQEQRKMVASPKPVDSKENNNNLCHLLHSDQYEHDKE